MSAEANTCARSAMIFAPLAAYSASGKPAAAPAPASTITSRPAFARLGMTAGTSATRRSPGYVSRGTPTIMKLPPSGPYGVTHAQYRQSGTNKLTYPRSRIFFERATPGNEWLPCSGWRGSQAGVAGRNRDATTHSVFCRTTRQITDFTCKLAKVQSKITMRKSDRSHRKTVNGGIGFSGTIYKECARGRVTRYEQLLHAGGDPAGGGKRTLRARRTVWRDRGKGRARHRGRHK